MLGRSSYRHAVTVVEHQFQFVFFDHNELIYLFDANNPGRHNFDTFNSDQRIAMKHRVNTQPRLAVARRGDSDGASGQAAPPVLKNFGLPACSMVPAGQHPSAIPDDPVSVQT
jgi:hypothetical protein